MKGFVWLNFARTRIIIWFLVGFVIGFLIMLTVLQASASFIVIESKTVTVGDIFPVNITLIPSEPVKAWELRLLLPGSLSLVNITIGTFFGDKPVFSIVNRSTAYALTLGPGLMVDAPGVLCIAWVKAEAEGKASVSLGSAGITNDTKYISMGWMDGDIVVLAGPAPPGPSPDDQEPLMDMTEVSYHRQLFNDLVRFFLFF